MELNQLITQTEQAITNHTLDPNCNRSVIRYEKLTKLWLQLRKQEAREKAKEEPELELDF